MNEQETKKIREIQYNTDIKRLGGIFLSIGTIVILIINLDLLNLIFKKKASFYDNFSMFWSYNPNTNTVFYYNLNFFILFLPIFLFSLGYVLYNSTLNEDEIFISIFAKNVFSFNNILLVNFILLMNSPLLINVLTFKTDLILSFLLYPAIEFILFLFCMIMASLIFNKLLWSDQFTVNLYLFFITSFFGFITSLLVLFISFIDKVTF